MLGRDFRGEKYRFGFQNQEKDSEIKGEANSLNYKFRMYDTRLGRFLAIDPLFKNYPFYSTYAFSGNRVIDAIEIEGLEPGILFNTPDAAANNFGILFNDNSIRSNREYGTYIYKVTTDVSFLGYTYAIPVIGQKNNITIPQMSTLKAPKNSSIVAFAHTHAASTSYGDNSFSGKPGSPRFGDIGFCEIKDIDGYVSTPNGSLLKYDVNTDQIIPLNMDQPKDTGPGDGGPGVSKPSTSIYEIKEGDTIKSIAEKYHTTKSEIQSENNLEKRSKLPVGTTLNITN
jgi:RHS repeat-associated protein